MSLRGLTESGIEQFRLFLGSDKVHGPAPLSLLEEPSHRRLIDRGVTIEPIYAQSKEDLARYLCTALGTLVERPAEESVGMWTGLALFYFDLICPVTGGCRRVREDSLYVLSGDWKKHHRHLIATPCRLYYYHQTGARVLLSGPPHKLGDLLEQVAARQDLISNQAVIGLLDALYYDRSSGRPKRGATDRKRPGSLRRLVDFLDQLELTYDLHSLTTEQLRLLLPGEEFARWLR